jgi:alpha-galactosidase
MHGFDIAPRSLQVIRETADAIVSSGLRDLGYEYVNVDCGWSAVNRTASGDIQPDPDRFPSGMEELGKYIHSLGLKFGLYTARGPVECCGRTGYNGSVHAAADAATFAHWGVDYLKIDSCGADGPGSEWDQFAAMRDALNATGRPVYVSVCEITPYSGEKDSCHSDGGVVYSPKMWVDQGLDVSTLANSILVEYGNNGNSFESVVCTMQAQQDLTFDNLSKPGSWNDNDMLTVGCSDHHVNEPWTPCINNKNPKTATDGRSEFTLFAVQASPLLLGNDVRHMSAATRATVSNREVIAVNQDPLGHRGEMLFLSLFFLLLLVLFLLIAHLACHLGGGGGGEWWWCVCVGGGVVARTLTADGHHESRDS